MNETDSAASSAVLAAPMEFFQQHMFGSSVLLILTGWLMTQIYDILHKLWNRFSNLTFSSMEIPDNIDAYNWMQYYLEQNVFSQNRSRHFLLTRNKDPVLQMEGSDSSSVELQTLPVEGTVERFWFRKRLIWMELVKINGESTSRGQPSLPPRGKLSVRLRFSVLGWNPQALLDLVQEARREFLLRKREFTTVYIADARERYWQEIPSKKSRPLDSVVLDEAVKEKLVGDVEQFMKSEQWYRERGIPYRRGYLLHGPPGCGKSSIIMAIAGYLQVPICIVNVGSKYMTDDVLISLMHQASPKGIILLEDVDTAFIARTRVRGGSYDSLSRDAEGNAGENDGVMDDGVKVGKMTTSSSVTLSGLLNVIDGVSAQEGRILFMTTNHLKLLDPALIRPGRVDRKVCIRLASKVQIQSMFERFYVASKTLEGVASKEIARLAREFAEKIPAGKHSMAKIQGYLLHYKDDPMAALKAINEEVEFDESEAEL